MALLPVGMIWTKLKHNLDYININFIAPFKIEDGVLHIAISDSSKLSLMRNLRTITKKEIDWAIKKITKVISSIE